MPTTAEKCEVVVSGITGKFPKCENLDELRENLYAGLELTTDEMPWNLDMEPFPKRMGFLRTFKEFDAGYFGILPKNAHKSCPMSRMTLEAAYEAIMDAGVNPDSLKGTKCGVYIAAITHESSQTITEPLEMRKVARGALSVLPCLLSGRIAYWLGVAGPTITVDTGCSTSLIALDMAVRDIYAGRCDAALVGGANMISLPYFTRLMAHDGFLAKEGRCRPFDGDASGFVRSEGVSMIFLQKSTEARRIYCTIVGTRNGGEGFKETGLTRTSGVAQASFLQRCYEEAGFNPLKINYVEAHGTGTKAGDPEEAYALDIAFNQGRTGALAIGSVKSNMGHTEAVAGISALTKVIIALETGVIAGTLHFNKLNPNIPALVAGRIQVFNKNMSFNEEFAAVNSFGLGGSLAHCIVKRHDKVKQVRDKSRDLPWLLLCSGRTSLAVHGMLDKATSGEVDPELVKLLHDIHSTEIRNHTFRGFVLVDGQGFETRSVSAYSGEKRPICFVFPGMGSQWAGMGKELLNLPVFANTIARCDQVLKTKGVDIYRVLCNREPGLFDYILNSFVGIVAIQIGLVDVLFDLGITPDIIVGQSLGELCCGYADGALDLEQTISAAYYRGLVSVESVFVPGAMAVVGMGHKELEKMLPEGVEIGCHNGPISSVISGRKQAVQKFCQILQKRNVYAREVPWSCGVAYHSSLLAPAVPKFLKNLQKVIPEGKLRSPRWISSSVKESECDSPLAKYSSAEYHCNNFANTVLFEEAFAKVPPNAITIEVAPNELLGSVMQQSGKSDLVTIPLCSAKAPSNLRFFLAALGRIYEAGFHPQVSKLYPPVEYPVSRGTKMISPMVGWDHGVEYYVPQYDDLREMGLLFSKLSLSDPSKQDYVIDGKLNYPSSACLVDVWKAKAGLHGKTFEQLPVVFSQVVFHSPIFVKDDDQLRVEVRKHTGHFEITVANKLCVSGLIEVGTSQAMEKRNLVMERPRPSKDCLPLMKKDFYKELGLRGFKLGDRFQNIKFVDHSLVAAEVGWIDDWVAAIDSLIQLEMIQVSVRCLQIPSKIQTLMLDPSQAPHDSEQVLNALVDKISNTTCCEGIQLKGLEFILEEPTTIYEEPLLEKYVFMAHSKHEHTSLEDAIHLCTHLAVENSSVASFRVIEVSPGPSRKHAIVGPLVDNAFRNILVVQCEIVYCEAEDVISEPDGSCNLLIINNLMAGDVSKYLRLLKPDGFLLIVANTGAPPPPLPSVPEFTLCVEHCWDNGRVAMMKKVEKKGNLKVIDLKEEKDHKWLRSVQETEKSEETCLIVATEPTSGILGLVLTLLKEMGKQKVRAFFLLDSVPSFSFDLDFFGCQLSKGLAVNVLQDGQWGSYRHIPLQISSVSSQQVIMEKGILIEGPLNRMIRRRGEIVNVEFSAVRDCPSTVAGSYSFYTEGRYLLEYSGKIAGGSQVMGFLLQPFGQLMSQIEAENDLMWPVPDSWSMSDAAAAPVLYCQALMALQSIGSMREGQALLITGADSPLGMAMISVGLHLSLKVFGICSSSSAIQLVYAVHPQLKRRYMFVQGDSSITREMQLTSTDGQGADAIVHLEGKLTLEQARCLRPDGKLILLSETAHVDMFLLPSITHVYKCKFELFITVPANWKYLQRAFEILLTTGLFAPMASIIKLSKVEPLCIRNSMAENLANMVLRWDGEGDGLVNWQAKPRCWFDPQQSHVVIGGLGGFGIEFITWMTKRGAKKFVICSRNLVRNGYQAFHLRTWREQGIEVITLNQDITQEEGATFIINHAAAMGPVGGVYHLGLVLEMGLLANLSEEVFDRMSATRFRAAKIFDQLTRQSCPDLVHFVMFSSITAGRGNIGQANYTYASSRMDRLCMQRLKDGFPAKSIQWGPVGEVGVLEKAVDTGVPGTAFQHIASCLSVLDGLMLSEEGVVCSTVLASKTAVQPKKAIQMRVAELMGIKDISSVPQELSLADLGMDSMMSVTIKNTLADEFKAVLSVPEVRNLTLAQCAKLDEQFFG